MALSQVALEPNFLCLSRIELPEEHASIEDIGQSVPTVIFTSYVDDFLLGINNKHMGYQQSSLK